MNFASPSRPDILARSEIRDRSRRRPSALPESQITCPVALTPVESALTKRLLRYKQFAPVNPVFSILTSTTNLYQSKDVKSLWIDTLINASRVTPLESALTKTPGGRGDPSLGFRLSRNLFNINQIHKSQPVLLRPSDPHSRPNLPRRFVTSLPPCFFTSPFGCSR